MQSSILMRTETKAKREMPCDFPTEKHKLRGVKLESCSLFGLRKSSEPGNFYLIIGRPLEMGNSKIIVSDGTGIIEVFYSYNNQS